MNYSEPIFFIVLDKNINKKSYVHINLSTPFPVRTRCRYCGKGPEHYYASKTATKWFNPNRIKDASKHYQKHIKRMIFDYYLDSLPKDFCFISPFTHTVLYKSYNPALHKKRGIPPVNDYVEFLCCNCGRTTWGFSQKSIGARHEITQRKARYSYPVKFDDWY